MYKPLLWLLWAPLGLAQSNIAVYSISANKEPVVLAVKQDFHPMTRYKNLAGKHLCVRIFAEPKMDLKQAKGRPASADGSCYRYNLWGCYEGTFLTDGRIEIKYLPQSRVPDTWFKQRKPGQQVERLVITAQEDDHFGDNWIWIKESIIPNYFEHGLEIEVRGVAEPFQNTAAGPSSPSASPLAGQPPRMLMPERPCMQSFVAIDLPKMRAGAAVARLSGCGQGNSE